MEIGNQIRELRMRRGITQEEMAQAFGVTAQAVSKWERGAAAPDIGLLPEISAYFGVTIDELFALSDENRMQRIENMLDDVRYLDPAAVESSRAFLLDKAHREPDNGRMHELLAAMENHLADEHSELAAEYAKEALRRDAGLRGAHSELVRAMRGKCWDWCEANHHDLIAYYQAFVREHPDSWHGLMWLMDQLLDDGRLKETEQLLPLLKKAKDDWRPGLYEGSILWHRGRKAEAYRVWEKLVEQYPDSWAIVDTIADFYARDGKYDLSAEWHRRAFEVGKAPRFTDPLISIAQIREIQGDIPGAIEARKDQLRVIRDEWNTSEGESIDAVQREIDRLRKLMDQ